MALFFKKYLRDMVYLLVIFGLGWWILCGPYRRQDEFLYREFGISLKRAINLSEMNLNRLYQDIDHEAFLYPTEHKKRYAENAKRIKYLVQNATDKLEDYAISTFIDDLNEHKRIEEKTIQELKLYLHNLADSLAFYTDHTFPPSSLYGILYSDSASYSTPHWAALSTGSLESYRIRTGIINLKYRILDAGIVALEYCYRKMPPTTETPAFYMPIISTTRNVIRPGEVFEADIFLTSFPPRTDFITVYVDNNPIATKGGVASYQRSFSTSGIKKIEVKIDLTNPLTEKVKPFHQTFEVLVVEPCPELR